MSIFELNNICYQNGNAKLLHDITLSIATNKLTAIMGLNGAGKSTLLRILSGARLPSRGSITLNKKELHSHKARELARTIAVVPQDFPTDFPYTVKEFALMGRIPWLSGLFPTSQDHERVQQNLEIMQLHDKADRTVTTLSGGEKQRLLLARALIQDTPVILLDEPANHLDIKNRMFLLNLLRKVVSEQHRTVIAVTHDFSDVHRFFDDTILLKNGLCLFSGSTHEAFDRDQLKNCFETDVIAATGLYQASGSCGFPNEF